MNKLYGIKYDKNVWTIKGDYVSGYKISRNESSESHFLKGNSNIVGINQIADNSFLIYYEFMRDKWKIVRLKFTKEEKIIEYSHRFSDFNFITNDVILFDKDFVDSATLYSISKNCEIPNLQFLISKSSEKPDCKLCKSREITLVKEESEYPTYLQVDYELKSFCCKKFIQVLVNPNTLSPLPLVYSTLRNNYISLSDDFTLENLFEEHNAELKIIDTFLSQLYYSDSRKSKSELCFEILNNH